MAEITTYKAYGTNGKVDELTINFLKLPPDFTADWLNEAKKDFKNEADIIVSALLKHAPGGLVDAIFVALAEHKAGVLIVPHVQDKADGLN
jgi:hypothetical protein